MSLWHLGASTLCAVCNIRYRNSIAVLGKTASLTTIRNMYRLTHRDRNDVDFRLAQSGLNDKQRIKQ